MNISCIGSEALNENLLSVVPIQCVAGEWIPAVPSCIGEQATLMFNMVYDISVVRYEIPAMIKMLLRGDITDNG